MNKLFSFLMILAAFFVLPACGGDDTGPGSNNCNDAAQQVGDALTEFGSNPTAGTCQTLVNAMNAALNACDGFVNQDQIDEWNDFLATDPCDGL